MIEEHAAPVGTPGCWTEEWNHLADGSLVHAFQFVVNEFVHLGREDFIGEDGQPVPGPTRIYVSSDNGMSAAAARQLAAELLTAAAMLESN